MSHRIFVPEPEMKMAWALYVQGLDQEVHIQEAWEHYQRLFPEGRVEGFAKVWNAMLELRDGNDRPISAAALGHPLPETEMNFELPPSPPRIGQTLVGLFCKREMREAVLGDLDEKFAELVERRGANVAVAWYWSQAARSALFFAVRWGRRLLELETVLKRIL